ncbi:MAG: hypothetical protein JXA10_04610 [Anaerolineae bacterium]|nr:hypothetical protein [Anaerolineae bacterium]
MTIKLWGYIRRVIVTVIALVFVTTTLMVGAGFAAARNTDLTDIPSYVAPINFDVGHHAYVMTDSLNIRSEPSATGSIRGKAAYKAELDVKDGPVINDEYRWWQVCYQGTCGWMADGDGEETWLLGMNFIIHGAYSPNYAAMSRAEGMQSMYFDDVPDLAYQGGPQLDGLVFAYFGLQLHQQASATSSVTADVPLYTVMEVLDRATGTDGAVWWKLRTMQGKTGWITEFDRVNRLLAPIRTYEQWLRGNTSSVTHAAAGDVFDCTLRGGQGRNMTGIYVTRGQTIEIEFLDGSWRAGPLPTWPFVGPEGDPQVPNKSTFPVPGSRIMSLVGGVGQSAPVYIGRSARFTSPASGELWLGANDDIFTDNVGSLFVRVTIR